MTNKKHCNKIRAEKNDEARTMLFNSFIFIFAFLPLCLTSYWVLRRQNKQYLSIFALLIFSWIFYAYWKPIYLLLLIGSILFNYLLSCLITRKPRKKTFAALGIIFNITLLGYFKYTLFFTDILKPIFDLKISFSDIFLPLGISFFTFQQITYLSDLSKGKIAKAGFIEYALFVSFFPQLIAGPIVHAKEIIPQFNTAQSTQFFWQNLANGISIFVIGLFKKVVIADSLSLYASPIFKRAGDGFTLNFFEAWSGALSYTFQLYFDFSGYSDMAIGLALMFGIILPINFNSPYKATSIIDFWRRWHITMSRFFRDYIYIPLGGNRANKLRQLVNLTLTMFAAGLWHGAGWTFIIWGLFHGALLMINHLFINLKEKLKIVQVNLNFSMLLAHLLTFAFVVIGWVIFRASDMTSALHMIESMLGLKGIVLPKEIFGTALPEDSFIRVAKEGERWLNNSYWCIPWIFVSYIICITIPSVSNLFKLNEYKLEPNNYITKSKWGSIMIALMFLVSILSMQRISEFLYFQF